MHIILLDEDSTEAELICRTLNAAGLSCERDDMIELSAEESGRSPPDLLILATGGNGGPVPSDLQRLGGHIPAGLPILLIVDRQAEDRILDALGAGVKDYLLRPLRRMELLARVRILLRRSYPDRQPVRTIFGPYVFEAESGRLTLADRALDVTQKEFKLALLLFQHLGRPLSRAFIRDRIWPGDSDMPSRTIDKHVSRVRSKLQLRPEHGYQLMPVYSFGYRLEELDIEQDPCEQQP